MQNDYLNLEHGGRLAEWRGPGTAWTVIENTAFVEVTGRFNFGTVVYAGKWRSFYSAFVVFMMSFL